MPFTTTDLIRAVLENLSRLAAGQPVSAEDSERVTLRMNSTFESLASLDIYPVPDADDIEAAALNHLADCVAVQCAPIFGRQAIRGEPLARIDEAAREALRAIARQRAARTTAAVEQFGRGGRGSFNFTTG
jgi:hypothetical protein